MRKREIFRSAVRRGSGREVSCPYNIFVRTHSWEELPHKKSCLSHVQGCQFDWDTLVDLVCAYYPRGAMDFNVKRLAADAGTFLSRAVQVSQSAWFAEVAANQR